MDLQHFCFFTAPALGIFQRIYEKCLRHTVLRLFSVEIMTPRGLFQAAAILIYSSNFVLRTSDRTSKRMKLPLPLFISVLYRIQERKTAFVKTLVKCHNSYSLNFIIASLESNCQDTHFFLAVRSQISTITVATFNTTLASFNVGYADFFSEHMRKLCNQVPIPEMPHEPLACANLPRSLTDSCINYSCLEDTDHIDGTNNFVHKNGMLDLSVS